MAAGFFSNQNRIDMSTFSDLKFKDMPSTGGIQARMFWPNGYGVSVVRHSFSYGGEQGLYELAVLRGSEKSSSLCYSTPVTDDVVGWQNEEGITELMRQVQSLPSA